MPHPARTDTFAVYKSGGTTADLQALIKMVLLMRDMRGELTERLRAIGQTASRMEMLAAVLNMEGKASQSDIAKRLRIEGASVTRLVDTLSQEGLLERYPDPTDRRINLLRITSDGEETLREIFQVYDFVRLQIISGFTHDELETLTGQLDRMLNNVEALKSMELKIV